MCVRASERVCLSLCVCECERRRKGTSICEINKGEDIGVPLLVK